MNTYRILTPSEYTALVDAVPKSQHRILVQTMMFTGMRYRELLSLSHNIKWFDAKNNAISIPAQHTKTNISRTIHLTPGYSKVLSQYLREFKTLGFPSRAAMNHNLRRWWKGTGTDMPAPAPKTFRKTWESWLLFTGYDYLKVCASQGHSPQIAYNHYANIEARLKSEAEKVKELTAGWGT